MTGETIGRQVLHSSKRCVVERIDYSDNGTTRQTVTKRYFKRALIRPQSLRARQQNKDPLECVHREVEMMKRVKHRGIVEFLGLKEDEHVLEIEMSDGGDALSSGRKYPIDSVVSWMKTISSALVSLHAQSIVHLDIKPSNIVIKDNKAQLCDFGSAMECTLTGQLPTFPNLTPAFSSPELCLMSMGAGSAVGMVQGRQQDMWALGVTLYSLVYGKMPFKCSEDVMTCYTSIVEDTLIIDEEDLPINEIITVIQRLLDKSPDTRLTAEKLYQML